MTPSDASQSEKGTMPGTIMLQRLDGIVRTGGMKTTLLTQPRTQSPLVAFDQYNQYCFHHLSQVTAAIFFNLANNSDKSR